jgi:sRNA-binding carbon storage regulator CsrA
MFVLSRVPGQAVLIGDEVRVDLIEIDGFQARLRITGPPEFMIRRAEPGALPGGRTRKPELVTDCRTGEKVSMGGVTIRVLHIGPGLVGLGIEAPEDLAICALELRKRRRSPKRSRALEIDATNGPVAEAGPVDDTDDLDGQILPLWRFARRIGDEDAEPPRS